MSDLFWKNNNNETSIKYVKSEEANQKFKDDNGADLEIIDNTQITEWFLDNYKNFGTHLEIITDKSSEGSQFVKGFGGIGGILRYKIETTNDIGGPNNQDDFNEDDFI